MGVAAKGSLPQNRHACDFERSHFNNRHSLYFRHAYQHALLVNKLVRSLLANQVDWLIYTSKSPHDTPSRKIVYKALLFQ